MILTVHSPQLSDPSQSSYGDEVVMVTGSLQRWRHRAAVVHRQDELALLQVAYLPEGV